MHPIPSLPSDSECETAPADLASAQALAPLLVAAAQEQYDRWDESDIDTFAGGGVCHLIADAFVQVLDTGGIDATSVSSTHEQHVYVVLRVAQGVYMLDIPWHLYERGGGFSWTKVHGVQFDSTYLHWTQLSRNPDAFDEFIE